MINIDLTNEEFLAVKRMRQEKINPWDYINIKQISDNHFEDHHAKGMNGLNDSNNKNWEFES